MTTDNYHCIRVPHAGKEPLPGYSISGYSVYREYPQDSWSFDKLPDAIECWVRKGIEVTSLECEAAYRSWPAVSVWDREENAWGPWLDPGDMQTPALTQEQMDQLDAEDMESE